MNDRYNKTSICSIVFLDIIEYSKKRDSEQIEVKNQFNALINHALKGVAESDRIILDTGDGAAIACQGSPEDALFISLTIRDEILKSNTESATPLFVRFGINLGPVRVVKDINNRPNIVGDGINVAQRIMSFAKPNQILVSRSYYEVTSRLTQETSQMFDYSGIKHDKHVREHEVYSVRPHQDAVIDGTQPIELKDERRLSNRLVATKKLNLKYVALSLPAIAAGLILLVKSAADTYPPTIILTPAVVPSEVKAVSVQAKNTRENLLLETALVSKAETDQHALKSEKTLAQDNIANAELPEAKPSVKEVNKKLENKKESSKKESNKKLASKKESSSKKAKQNEVNQMPPEMEQTQVVDHSTVPSKAETAAKTAELTAEKDAAKKESVWSSFKESVKQGGESKCTQVQISMNQCS